MTNHFNFVSDGFTDNKEEEKNEEVIKEPEVIDSYEALIIKKQADEKREQLEKYMKLVKERIARLSAQGKTAQDRVGKTCIFYRDVWNAIKSESPQFLNADITKQTRLLELLVARESEQVDASTIMQALDEEFPELRDWF